MYFKLCQRCDRFFYSDRDYRSHDCNSPDNSREVSKIPEQKKEEKKPATTTPPNDGIKESDIKERRKALIVSMKKLLAEKGIDCATLKLEQLKPLYAKTFGEKALAEAEKSFGMDGEE